MKVLDKHWEVGPYCKYHSGDAVRVYWTLVRAEAMTSLERLQDDNDEVMHESFVRKFRDYLDRVFKERGLNQPDIHISCRPLLFALRRKYPFFQPLEDAKSSDDLYSRHPDLAAFIKKQPVRHTKAAAKFVSL